MDNPLGRRALHAVGVYMGHYVMAHLAFTLFGHVVIDILRMGFQFIDLLPRDRQSHFMFCLRKRNPEPAPCLKLHIIRENMSHFTA